MSTTTGGDAGVAAFARHQAALYAAARVFNKSVQSITSLPDEDNTAQELKTFQYCHTRIVPTTIVPSSVVFGSITWALIASVGKRMPQSPIAQLSLRWRVPLAASLAGLHLAYNTLNKYSRFHDVCYLCALAADTEIARSMREAYRRVYPDAMLLSEADRMAAGGAGIPTGSPQADLTTRIMQLGPFIPSLTGATTPGGNSVVDSRGATTAAPDAPHSLLQYSKGAPPAPPLRQVSAREGQASERENTGEIDSFSFAEGLSTADGAAADTLAAAAASDGRDGTPLDGTPLDRQLRRRHTAAARSRLDDTDTTGDWGAYEELQQLESRPTELDSRRAAAAATATAVPSEPLTSWEQRRRRREGVRLMSHHEEAPPRQETATGKRRDDHHQSEPPTRRRGGGADPVSDGRGFSNGSGEFRRSADSGGFINGSGEFRRSAESGGFSTGNSSSRGSADNRGFSTSSSRETAAGPSAAAIASGAGEVKKVDYDEGDPAAGVIEVKYS